MGSKRKKEVEVPKPHLCRHCKRCGKWFIATHPKDTQEYCERCRSEDGSGHIDRLGADGSDDNPR